MVLLTTPAWAIFQRQERLSLGKYAMTSLIGARRAGLIEEMVAYYQGSLSWAEIEKRQRLKIMKVTVVFDSEGGDVVSVDGIEETGNILVEKGGD